VGETAPDRPKLSEDIEVLAERAVSRGAIRRATDLRAVAEHLRAREAKSVVVDVRPEALAEVRRQRTTRLRRLVAKLRRR
jgi:hypothetical protein